ncbi:MAG TPA: SMI1/KNR4 family protein [Candidatus Solibacter sp.]|nr:SMI1/KNR4 family protein [Candidatus Solibacter sp.]
MQTLLVEAFGPLVVAFALFVAVFGVRRLIHQFRNRLTPEQHQAERDSFRNRLVHPHAGQVEQGIGALLPQRLITLYEDHQTILTEQIEIRRPEPDPRNLTEPKNPAEWIEAFLPLDLESQKLAINLTAQGWGKGFCFATDGSGNFYWIPAADVRQADAPVFFAHTDPVANEQVAASLDELLTWPRTLHSSEAEADA